MPSSPLPDPEELDRLLRKLAPSIAEILRERDVSEADAEQLLSMVLIRLTYRWSRIADPERWLLSTIEDEARDLALRSRKEPLNE